MKCCDLTAGMLRHITAFEAPYTTADGQGGLTGAWTPIATAATVRGFLKPASGSERQFAAQLENPITHHFFTRYRTDILPAHRMVYEGRYFQVRAIVNIEERKQWLDITLEEGVAT